MKRIQKNEKGITLIALVITIIVLIILAGVVLRVLTGENGLINRAVQGKDNTRGAAVQEAVTLAINENRIVEETLQGKLVTKADVISKLSSENKLTADDIKELEISNIIKIGNKTIDFSRIDFIKKDTSYVGCYADIDDDGTVDGIIYADLTKSVSGSWGDYGRGDYSYEALNVDSLKNYYKSQERFDGDFGEKPVLSASGTGSDRFYVMALKDVAIDGTSTAKKGTVSWNWYYSAYDKLDSSMKIPLTGEDSNDFGQGKIKTQTMISKWNQEAYESKNAGVIYKDVWGIFKDTRNDSGIVDSTKWFIPSKGEWSAFGEAFNVSKTSTDESYYSNLGLSGYYWSSSCLDKKSAIGINFHGGYTGSIVVTNSTFVRLSTTF